MVCQHRRYKKVLTHGEKSRGYYVCKDCNKVIKNAGNNHRKR